MLDKNSKNITTNMDLINDDKTIISDVYVGTELDTYYHYETILEGGINCLVIIC